jgi:hypothetical protein
VTRFWPNGVCVVVRCDALATPQQLIWEGQQHSIVEIWDRWRVDEGWWRKRAWREYFQIITRSGLLLEIYHDVPTGLWYIQRVYD